jgi:hypothetical protein
MRILLIAAASAALLSAGPAPADSAASEDVAPAERAAILAAVDAFFDAMRERDADTWDDLLVAAGNTWRWQRGDGDRWEYRHGTNAASIESLRSADAHWDERMFDPTVLARGPIAVVWTPYTFHLDGAFHHCGIDAFNLMKVDGRWRLVDAMWTAEVEGCETLVPAGALAPR